MESMKHQINLLCQLQELILTRDEHHHTGDGTHLDSLNDSIDALASWSRSPRRSTSASTRKTIS